MVIRPYVPTDYAEWRRMRTALWPDQTEADMSAWLVRPDAVVLVAVKPPSGLAGFAEVGARPFVDGCESSPVAYLEGWYVDADQREQGIGAALIHAVEDWARAQGYRELASDTELDNLISQRAHERLGFSEVERAVRYRNELG
jgi:aminoglycoside 6'-N-acetyltransferase I